MNGQAIGYTYNDQGIRTSSIVDGVETRYLLDEGITANVWEEYSPNGTVQASYVYGNDLILQDRSGVSSFYLVDGLGSTRLLTDSQGQVLNAYGYEAFGETVSQSGTATNAYQYAGEQFDGAMGDYYLRQRFYDTSSGRFGRMDTYEGRLNEPLTLHKYLYSHANPITNTDPTGFSTISELSQIGAIIGALAGTGIGGYVGYQKNGNKIGWPVFAYALAGGLTGLVAGAQFGALIGQLGGATSGIGSGGSLGTITKMTPKLVQQISRMISTRSWIYAADGTAKALNVQAFIAGIISGGVAGAFTPKEYKEGVNIASLSSYTGGNVAIIGYRWFQQAILGARPFVPGGIELATVYVTGFNAGYFTASAIRSQVEGAR